MCVPLRGSPRAAMMAAGIQRHPWNSSRRRGSQRSRSTPRRMCWTLRVGRSPWTRYRTSTAEKKARAKTKHVYVRNKTRRKLNMWSEGGGATDLPGHTAVSTRAKVFFFAFRRRINRHKKKTVLRYCTWTYRAAVFMPSEANTNTSDF